MARQKLKSLDLSKLSWARVVSDICSPPVVWGLLVMPVAAQYTETRSNALFWAILYSLFICVIPVVFISWMVATGKIGDIHMKERKERFRPLLVAIVCTSIVWWLLHWLHAPLAFPLLAVMTLVQITFIMLITLAWQISMHMISIAGATVAIGIIFSVDAAMTMIPLVMLVGAARLRLKRHTPAQVIAGTIVGALVPVLMLGLIPISILQAV
jgi:membrane-associated phospholipid phosphatase